MSFGRAFQYCFKNYKNFNGRASRSEFWWFMLATWLGNIALKLIDGLLGHPQNYFAIIWEVAVFIPQLAVGCRRLHDIGRSGWWQWMMLIPCVGLVVLIVFWATAPQPSANEYGVSAAA